MQVQEIENEIAEQQGRVKMYCPFGCGRGQADGLGYCCHLVGFTNDKRVMETIEPIKRPVYDENHKKTGEMRETGNWRTNGKNRQPVLKTDTLVNPQKAQKDEHGTHMMFLWCSWRVYRPCDEETAQAWQAKYAHPEDEFGDNETPEERVARLETELAEARGATEEAEPETKKKKKPVPVE